MTEAARDPADREGFYHPAQIVAHWTVVFLVLFQFMTGGGMETANALQDQGLVPIRLSGNAWVHGMIGTSILLVMLYRLWLRLNHHVPPPPSDEPRFLQLVSRGTHWVFYGLMNGMPIFGMIAVFTTIGIFATLHGLAAWALLALIVLHFAGAMWHAFKRDGVVKRVLRQDPAGQYDATADSGGSRISHGEGQT